jgi:hypothetical protein
MTDYFNVTELKLYSINVNLQQGPINLSVDIPISNLKLGDNPVKIICQNEDGYTEDTDTTLNSPLKLTLQNKLLLKSDSNYYSIDVNNNLIGPYTGAYNDFKNNGLGFTTNIHINIPNKINETIHNKYKIVYQKCIIN